MTFISRFTMFLKKHVLCFSCSVTPSRLKHQIVGSRYRRCCVWCTRSGTLYPSMALGKAFRYPLSLFLQSTSWDTWESFGSTFFPKASAGGFLLGYARVEFSGFGGSGDTVATRCGLDFSLRKLGQKFKMCVSRDVVISKLA